MLKWRLLLEEGRLARHTFPQPDMIIAPITLLNGLTIVTRDGGDFVPTKVPVFNPWTDTVPR